VGIKTSGAHLIESERLDFYRFGSSSGYCILSDLEMTFALEFPYFVALIGSYYFGCSIG
jgi:hypothetical protein